MHYTPLLEFYILRYWNKDGNASLVVSSVWEEDLQAWNLQEYLSHFAMALGTYCCWCLCYYLLIFVVLKKRIEKRGYDTLFK